MRKINKNVYAFISKQFIRHKTDELFCLQFYGVAINALF